MSLDPSFSPTSESSTSSPTGRSSQSSPSNPSRTRNASPGTGSDSSGTPAGGSPGDTGIDTGGDPVFAGLPERALDRHELRGLIERLAGRPEDWRERVDFPDGRRHYVSLHRDEYVDVWLLCWTPENDTGWHDHDISSGAVAVVQGALKECNPRIGGAHVEVEVATGTSFCFGPEHIHRLVGSADRSVSIHAYSPPLWRLGQYSIDEDGVMRRNSVSYADELRPLDAVA